VALVDGSNPELKVRLLYLDTPESRGNSHGEAMPEGKLASAYLGELLPRGLRVTLWGPDAALERDRYDRALAVIIIPPTKAGDQPAISAQERMIAAGWSPLWEKYGPAHERWRPALQAAEDAARAATAGAWATAPQYMLDKSNETTARKAK
jgi:endonuclease YncB( thermonuclease family)